MILWYYGTMVVRCVGGAGGCRVQVITPRPAPALLYSKAAGHCYLAPTVLRGGQGALGSTQVTGVGGGRSAGP